jgi:hypothetical protein
MAGFRGREGYRSHLKRSGGEDMLTAELPWRTYRKRAQDVLRREDEGALANQGGVESRNIERFMVDV